MANKFKIFDKNTKNIAKITLCSTIGLLLLSSAFRVGAFVWQEKEYSKQRSLISKTNYTQFNEQYKLEEIDKLTADLESGKLTPEEFVKRSKQITDYSRSDYMKNSPDVSTETREAFIKSEKEVEKASGLDVAAGVAGLGACASMVGGAAAYFVEEKKFRQGYPEKTK